MQRKERHCMKTVTKHCPPGGASIRLTRTSLPSHAILGEDLVLECGYDMEGDRLYSVKWCVVIL